MGQAEKKAYRPGGNGAQGYRPVLSTRQAGMPAYLNACRYLCDFRRNAPGGSGRGKNKYKLRNKANKSFRINISAWEEVQKATKKRNEIPTRSP